MSEARKREIVETLNYIAAQTLKPDTMRTSSVQFTCRTREEAAALKKYLESITSAIVDMYGLTVAVQVEEREPYSLAVIVHLSRK